MRHQLRFILRLTAETLFRFAESSRKERKKDEKFLPGMLKKHQIRSIFLC